MRGGAGKRSDIEEQAILRLTAMLENSSPTAEAELAEWIAQDPAHGVAYAQAEAAWEASARLAQGEDPEESGSNGEASARPGRMCQR